MNKEETNIPDPEKVFKDFKKKWDKMSHDKREETLLNMIINLGYRMDILASIVSEIDEVKEMTSTIDPQVQDIMNGESSPKI